MKKIILFCYGKSTDYVHNTTQLLVKEILRQEGEEKDFQYIEESYDLGGFIFEISEKFYEKALSLGFRDFIL